MAIVIPNAGEALLLEWMLGKTAPEAMTLKLYTNNYTPIETSVAGSFTEASGSGYAAKSLASASWSVVSGDPAVGSYAQQTWTFTGALGSVYGYYVVGATSGTILWAERFTDGPYTVGASGDAIRITPRMTLKDQQDA